MIALGIPYSGVANLLGDSGYIETIEPLIYMGRNYDVKSLLYLDKSFSGLELPLPDFIKASYSEYPIVPRHNSYKCGPGLKPLSKCFPGKSTTPVDFVFTNRKFGLSEMFNVGLDSGVRKHLVPIILDVLKSGLDAPGGYYEDLLLAEAIAYAEADRIVFSTSREKELGLAICKKFLSSAVVRNIDKNKSLILGDGISDVLVDYRRSKEDVERRLQSPKKELKIAMAGRINSNKGIDVILEVIRMLYKVHGVSLTLVTQSSWLDSAAAKAQDIKHLVKEILTGVTKHRFVSEVLPSLDMLLNASKHEGYTVLVAEAVYTGVPVMLPRKRWAEALVGEWYPFFYKTQQEMYSLINAIRNGKTPPVWIAKFEKSRRKLSKELASETSEGVYRAAKKLVEETDREIDKIPHSRIVDTVLNIFPVGEVRTVGELYQAHPAISCRARANIDGFFLYKFLKPYVEMVDPSIGLMKRLR